MIVRRALVLGVAAFITMVGISGQASAAPVVGTCTVSTTTVPQGGTFTVRVETTTAGELVTAVLDGGVLVGSGNSGTGVAPFIAQFTATIPPATSANVTHTLTVTSLGVTIPCPGILVLAAATPTPTVAPVTPTPRPADDDDDDGGPTQTQQQEQSIVFPVAAPIAVPAFRGGGGGSSLPKTGVDVAEVGGIGTLSLLAGVSLMEFARRRRRHWLTPAVPNDIATEVVSDHVVVQQAPAEQPVIIVPDSTEADLLLPYAQRVWPSDPADFITPGF